MKTQHKIFFAIPFDSATKAMYERVANKIRQRFGSVTTVIGTSQVGPSLEYSSIATFRAQNRELMTQFVAQIRDADVIVADLTHNNPNVHVELGIALTENKNILRVTGRSLTELAFDIRNLDVRSYKDETSLIESIERYLTTFFEIKKLDISAEHGDLYRVRRQPLMLDPVPPDQIDLHLATAQPFILRDGAIRARFEFIKAESPADWFGILFRAAENPFLGSHMVYIRQNGAVEVALYPGPQVFEEKFQLSTPFVGQQEVTIEVENNELTIAIGTDKFTSKLLARQTHGLVFVATWRSRVTLSSLEIISRDTIDWV
jgi:nucleoside 2-deoxyribosyltransferase